MKKVYFAILIFLFFVCCTLIYNMYKEEKKKEKLELINNITEHYNNYVKTNKESIIYELNNDEYTEIGAISKDVELVLDEIIIDENTTYFNIKELNYHIKYEDVEPISAKKENSNHYKKYIVFNENVITKETTNFYDELGRYYKINKSYNLPIIIKETDRYYVEIFNQLLYVKKEDVEKVVENSNAEVKTRDNIRTFAYHFVYKDGEECTNSFICHPEEQFRSHMKYLSENDYFALTMNDLNLFLDGKIQIPEKSVVITLDDGYLAPNAIKILEEYKLNATYFVVTSWLDIDKLKSDYVELHSHTNDMHNNYRCAGSEQGSQLLCEEKNIILEDLKTSRNKLNGSIAFAYPFYEYNSHIKNILNEVGFELAFVGISNTLGYADRNTDKLLIPRLTINSTTTLDEFISYLK